MRCMAVFASSAASPPQSYPLMVQIELTTLCNFDCFYCAGRQMDQRHMAYEAVCGLLDALPMAPGGTVSLQGEGEPTLHPRFWDLVRRVRERGWHPYTITNGSRVDAARFAALFPRVGLSLDTVDPQEASRIGRHNLRKVMRNLRALVSAMGPERVVVHTTLYGQPTQALRDYVRGLGIVRHIAQPLQPKADYVRRYDLQRLAPAVSKGTPAASRVWVAPRPKAYTCKYLERPLMRYFNLDGVEMPCCFIKDASAYRSIPDLRETLARRQVPAACRGCAELK